MDGNGQVELANVICGIEKEFQGKVLINSKDVSKKGVKSRKKLLNIVSNMIKKTQDS